MNFKTTYILFGLLVVMLAIFGLSQMFGTKPGDESFVMADLREAKVTADDIDQVDIERARPTAEKLVFILDRDKKRWKMIQPFEARADSDAVSQVVRNIINARKEEKADMTANLEKFGLEPPASVVILKRGVDQEWKLNIGKESAGGPTNAVVYVTSSGRPKKPAAVKRSDLDSLFKTVNDFRSKELLADGGDLNSSQNIQLISLHEPKHDPVVLTKDADERWRFEKPAFGDADYEGDPGAAGQDKKITGVRELISSIDNLRVESSADFIPGESGDMAKYGLDSAKPEGLRVEIKRKPSDTSSADAAKEASVHVLLVGKKADDKGDKLYARLETENTVVKIAAKNVEALLKVAENPGAIRNRDLVLQDQFKIDAIDIKNANGLIKLRKPQTSWKLFAADGAGRSAEEAAVTGLLSSLDKKRQVQSFPDPAKEKDMGFDAPTAPVISLWTGGLLKEKNEDKAEDKKDKKEPDKKNMKAESKDLEPKLKDAKPEVKLTFGKKENNLVYVRRESARGKALLMVPDSLLTLVNQGPLAYLERALPSFSENDEVAEVILDRNGEAYDILKEQKDPKAPPVWKFKQPKDLAGRLANGMTMDEVIRDLRGLRAETLVSENPSPAVLDQYGLKSPSLKATVVIHDKDKKPDSWVYFFGKETEDKKGRYAKLDKKNWIFVVKQGELLGLNGELQDTTIFQFDANKVKELKLTGWKKVASFTFTLDLKREGSKSWVVKTPPDFDLDSNQVDSFLANLSGLRAKRFVVRKTGPKPEHQLGPRDQVIHIEVTIDGAKAPLTLTLGGFNELENAYYAQSSALPGDVVLVPRDHFEKVLAGPKYFSKKIDAAK